MTQEKIVGSAGFVMRPKFLQGILKLAEEYGPSDSLETVYDKTCAKELNAMIESGEAQRIAEERGISECDAIVEMVVELREPYRRIKERHARQQWEAYDREVAQLESIGSIPRIKAHAKKHGVTFADALEVLTPTPPPVPRPRSGPLASVE